MFLMYMSLWSIFIIAVLALFRLRNWSQLMVVTFATFVTLLVTAVMFKTLSEAVGIVAFTPFFSPAYYLSQGLAGLLALLVMPCGWLGPFIGLSLVSRRLPSNPEGFGK